jgi:asparagine synthase (glutamine-hydrolysing)
MFAFAVADFSKRELFLARDHFGIKPLAYLFDGKRFGFASEIRALASAPGWTGDVDLLAIDEFLRYQYIPEPRTAFRNVHKLKAGHCMTVRMGEPHVKIEQYFTAQFSGARPKRGISDEELDLVLRDSVKRHLVSDVPFGAFLSGGIDSSLIVSYMAELIPGAVKTFSIGFDDPGVSEMDEARKVAERFGTDHHEEIVHVEALSVLPDIVRHYGEPFGDQSAIPTWYVSRLARQSVPMVLSGDGGDELFAGYPTYGWWLERIRRLTPATEIGTRANLRNVARRVWPSRYATPANPASDPHNWLAFVGRFSKPERESLWRPEYRFVSDAPDRGMPLATTRGATDDTRPVQNVDLSTFLPSDILTKVDIAAMAFGLEVRPPMLDVGVFEAAARVSSRSLYSFDKSGQFSGKLPLKRLLSKHLGEKFVQRPKQGFALPLRAWLYDHPPTRSEIRSRLTGSDSSLSQLFEPIAVAAAINKETPANTWLLLVLDEWMRQQASARAAAA